MAAAANCVRLDDGSCSSIDAFDTEAKIRAATYAAHAKFQNQEALSAIGADRAYAHVNLLKGQNAAAGAGVTIGFLDSGIDTGHPMFSGKTVTEVFTQGATNEDGLVASHGTGVASVAAGIRDHTLSNGPHGVAWGADIAMFAVRTSSSAGDDLWASRLNTALDWRSGDKSVDILNVSLGLRGIIDNYSESELRTDFAETITALAQTGTSEKTILVWAAGNDHGIACSPPAANCENGKINAVSPTFLAGLTARIAELRGHSIAVVALDSGSKQNIVSSSNRCGIAADYCIAAPGRDIEVAYFGLRGVLPFSGVERSIRTDSGTSYSAPMVAGGLAIMKQLFRDELSNTELVTRLLETADNTGVYADSTTYGRGKLDLAAATHPVGVLEVPVGTNANSAGYNLRATRLSLGGPFGNGLVRSISDLEIMALDDLGAPFWYRLGDFVEAAKGPAIDGRVWHFLANPPSGSSPWREVRVQHTSAGADSGHLSLAKGGLMVTFAARESFSASLFGTRKEHAAAGATLNWRREGLPLGIRLGWIGEDGSILGSEGEGAFGSLAADTAFLRIRGDVRLGAWRLGIGAEWGSVRSRTRGGIIEEVSPMTTSAFSLKARAGVTDQDVVRLSLSQPLRVEAGRSSSKLPVARNKDGRAVYKSFYLPVVPDGRQIDLTASWDRRLVIGRLRVGVNWSRNPGHVGSADPRLTFFAGWRREF